MTPAERIRVHIAGDIYPKRGLVRRFLEDDGYDVIGQTTSRKTLLAAIRKNEPDAIVVDDELLMEGPGGGTLLARIRKAVPDAKVIVFTSSPASGAPALAGADGYLEKGVGLAALTSLLGRIFADETPRIEPAAAGAAAGATGTAARIAASAPVADAGPVTYPREPVGAPGGGGPAGATARIVAIAGGAILIVWGMIAMLATGGGPTPPPADRTDRGGTVVAEGDDALDEAYASLRRLMVAIESGNYVLAGIEAEALLDARQQAVTGGFAIIGLDAEVTARLGTLVAGLPARVNTTLSAILGSLYPVLPDEDVPGGGSDVLIGPAFTGGTTGVDTGGNGNGTGGQGSVGGQGEGGIIVVVGPGGDPGGNGGGEPALGPGDGRAWGHSHKERHVVGEAPPWANGNAFGHDRSNGRAVGHGRTFEHNA